MGMTLQVHRSERSDGLLIELADLMASRPLRDVFAEEVVAVPARGVERWLLQRLSHRLGSRAGSDGVCAGVRFPSPTALMAEVLGVGEKDPWSPDRLVWPLLLVIDEVADQEWCSALGRHLGIHSAGVEREERQGRRFAVARRLAGLFHSYASYRPRMLASWAAGDSTDGLGDPLPADLAWQARLWRLVRDRVGGVDPVQRLATVADLAAINDSLPERVSLFGLTRIPAAQLAVWSALAMTREVHLWLPQPSPHLWARTGVAARAEPMRRRLDPTSTWADHPLLASLGREARELRLALRTGFIDTHHSIGARPDTLLGRLQSDLTDDRASRPAGHAAADRSIQVHACHGPARQVEVLREVLVGMLADDPTLEPRDILVMCPDVETYAPLIEAGFGLADATPGGHPAHRFRVQLADRALQQTNPLISMAARLLAMSGTRITASQLLDLAGSPPVRRRFSFDDDQLATLARWVAESGVRWGFDAAHRQEFGLEALPQNTWRAGVDRILLGVAAAGPGHWVGSALPLDEVGSADVELAGRLAELVDRLRTALDALTGEHDVAQWLAALSAGVSALTAVSESDRWQVAELQREFGAVLSDAGSQADSIRLRLTDIRALLAGRLAGRPTRANFRTGTLTVCTMVPMRSVPHRVVCLLGLDDGVFPRRAWVDGDDVLGRDPVVGERDPRAEDRQLLLDAVLSATESLVITYTGADPRTGAVRPPSVPLGELLDVLAVMSAAPLAIPPSPPGASVLLRHPLQPFDSRVVTAGALGRAGPFSFDPSALAGARAAAHRRTQPTSFLVDQLPAAVAPVIRLAELVDLLRYPARGFLRQRLGIAVPSADFDRPTVDLDGMTIDLERLELWRVGRRLLADRLAGLGEDACRQAELRRGTLPPGRLGTEMLARLLAEITQLLDGTARFRATPVRTVEVLVTLQDGRELRGTVGDVRDGRIVRVDYVKLAAPQRIRTWIELVALAAAQPQQPWSAMTVGRGVAEQPRASTLRPIDTFSAQQVLSQLVDLHDRALRSPLPMPAHAGAAYAAARRDAATEPAAMAAARRAWTEQREQDEAHEQIWGTSQVWAAMIAEQALPDESWSDELHRFGELTRRFWDPLLAHERIRSL